MQAVGFRQGRYIGVGEAADESRLRRSIGLHQLAHAQILRHQSGQLLAGVAGRPLQVAQHQSFVGTPQFAVAESLQYPFDVTVTLFVSSACLKFDLRRPRQKLA